MYSPGGQRIVDIILRRGDAQAAHALRSGDIWAGAAAGLGQTIGAEVQRRDEEKKRKQADAAFQETLSTWDQKDPVNNVKRLSSLFGPEDGMKIASGVDAMFASQNKPPDQKLFAAKIGALKTLKDKMGPDWVAQNWATVSQSVAPDVKAFLGVDLGPDPTPDHIGALDALDEQLNPKAEGGGFTLGAGQTRFDASGKQIAAGPAEAPKSEARVVGRSLVGPDGKVIYRDPEATGGQKLHEVKVPGPDGTIVTKLVTEDELRKGVTTAPNSTGQKPILGAERTALAFFNRAKEATDDIEDLENRIVDRNAVSQEWNTSGVTPNRLKSQDQQLYEARQRSFTEARLRKESGAAIPESEFENDRKTYWAKPGDSKETIELKRKMRAGVLQGLAYSSGRAYEEFYGEPAPRAGSAKGGAAGPLAASDDALLKKYGY